jgi:hypothetical protein
MADDRLERAFTRASDRLRECKRARTGGVAAEVEYGAAYQRLVRAGKAPQLRAKYRRRPSK